VAQRIEKKEFVSRLAGRMQTDEATAARWLSDSSREPHMTMSELCEKIGVSQGNASAKSREI
jgi:DNA-binding transcriptional ArsR family regulator